MRSPSLRHSRWIEGLFWVGLIVVPNGARSLAQAPAVELLAEKELIDAAMHSYETARASYETRTSTKDDVFRWSNRWMQAELRTRSTPAARAKTIEAHLQRLRAMQLGVDSWEITDLAYHITEAELLLAETDPQAKTRLDRQLVARRDLQGQWHALDGDAGDLFSEGFRISGRVIYRGPDPVWRSTALLDVDPTQSPKWIDIRARDDDLDIEKVGIYQLTDGVLTICWAGPGNPRPSEFSNAKGNSCRRYKRVSTAK
jgi:uncharacterized protein (TIGR03067 family)